MSTFDDNNHHQHLVREAQERMRKIFSDRALHLLARAFMKEVCDDTVRSDKLPFSAFVVMLDGETVKVEIPASTMKGPQTAIPFALQQVGCKMAELDKKPMVFGVAAIGQKPWGEIKPEGERALKDLGIVVDIATVDGRGIQGFVKCGWEPPNKIKDIRRPTTRYDMFNALDGNNRSIYPGAFFVGFQSVSADKMLRDLLKDIPMPE